MYGSNAVVELAQTSSRAEDDVPAFLSNSTSLGVEPKDQSLHVHLSRRDDGLRSFAVAPAVAASNGNSLCYPITSPEEQEASGICPTELVCRPVLRTYGLVVRSTDSPFPSLTRSIMVSEAAGFAQQWKMTISPRATMLLLYLFSASHCLGER